MEAYTLPVISTCTIRYQMHTKSTGDIKIEKWIETTDRGYIHKAMEIQ